MWNERVAASVSASSTVVTVWLACAFSLMALVSSCQPRVMVRGPGGARGGGEGRDFVRLDVEAKKAVDASLPGRVLGKDVTVRYPAALLDEGTVQRFLDGLESYQSERDAEYQVLRDGLRAHLGAELFARIEDAWYLRNPELPATWFLLVGERPTAVVWGSPDSSYHYLRAGLDSYDAADLRPQGDLKYEVHTKTHFIIRALLTSRRGVLPRWLEEGICDYVSMQYERWKDKSFDGGREVLSRLTWSRLAIRQQLWSWRHSGPSVWHENDWESDFLYKASLGLVFSLEVELGSRGLVDLLEEIITKSPETDKETVAIIEGRVGKPLDEVGRMSPEARSSLLSTLLLRAETACASRAPSPEGLRLAAMGHFPEAADRVVPALQSLATCADEELAIEGLTGLRYLGEQEHLKTALAQYRSRRSSAAAPDGEQDNRLVMCQDFATSRLAARWFGGRTKETEGH